PEYLCPDRLTLAEPERANQYRLGLIGYEMIVGSATFMINARNRQTPNEPWTRIHPHQPRGFPHFLSPAIQRRIDSGPSPRFLSLKQAVESIAHRVFQVEVARDSFRRILDKDERAFFGAFYTRLLGYPEIAGIFRKKRFPPVDHVAET